MDNRQRFAAPVTGGSSLLVIFGVLCLTVFALLSLATVQADMRLSQASVESITAYYQADARAEEILGTLRSGKIPSDTVISQTAKSTGSTEYRYSCPISDTQELVVQVEIRGENDYSILCWKVVSTAEWMPDDSINVWDGEVTLWN